MKTKRPATEADFGESEWFKDQFGEAIEKSESLRPDDGEEWTCFLCGHVDDVFEFEWNMCDACFSTQIHRWAQLFDRSLE